MKQSCRLAFALALGMLWSGEPLAHADAMHPSGRVGWQDTNGDGVVTRAEARAAAARLFERFDRNHDGVVTGAEAWAAAPGPSRARFDARFAERDGDRDGWLSRWESKLPPRRFVRVDRDGDGRVSSAELWRATRRSSAGQGEPSALRSLLLRRDLDADGRVTLAEAQRAAELRFRRRDRDGDGRLTARDGRDGVSPASPRGCR